MDRNTKINYVNLKSTQVSQTTNSIIQNKTATEIDSSRLPLNEDIDERKNKVVNQIKKEFNRLAKVIKLSKLLFLVYFILLEDLFIMMYYSAILINSCTSIFMWQIAILYLIEYASAIVDMVLLMKIVIYAKYERKDNAKAKANANADKTNDKIAKKNHIDPDKLLTRCTIYLNDCLKATRDFLIVRLIGWLIKLFTYMFILAVEDESSVWQYVNITIMVFEYILYELLKFFYITILRKEAYKTVYEWDKNLEYYR